MNKCFLLFFCFCLYCHAYGQKKDISGIYISDSSPKIEIKGEELIYTEHSDHLPIWHNDTLAICKIKQVDKHVWEISSLDSFYDIYRTMEIVPSYCHLSTDSVKVIFQFPYSLDDLRIKISTDMCFFSNDGVDSKCVYIPKGTEKIVFFISLEDGSIIHTVYGQSYGVRYLQSFEEHIDPNADCITIKLPLLDNHFFEKYLITREYIYVDGDKLYWKDKDFKKIREKKSIK